MPTVYCAHHWKDLSNHQSLCLICQSVWDHSTRPPVVAIGEFAKEDVIEILDSPPNTYNKHPRDTNDG